MKETRKMEMTTKERILEAACRAFAERGFRQTTIAAICQAAEANIAAVNYYFGSKEKLYEAVWEYATAQAEEIYGPDDQGETPEEWLRRHSRNLVMMIFDEGPGGWIPRLIRRDIDIEMEGELMENIRSRFLEPHRQQLEKAVASILNRDPASFAVRCVTSHIHAMCIFLNIKMKFRRHIFGAERPDSREIEFLIKSMQEFIKGGIEQVRSALKSGELSEINLEGNK